MDPNRLQPALCSIDELQRQLVDEFALCDGDPSMLLDHLMDLGAQMPSLEPTHKTEAYAIPGCLAKVWLVHQAQEGSLFLQADSNAAITKGLISTLVRVCSGQPARSIWHANLFFIEATGIAQLIGAQRKSGFASMLKQIKQLARHHMALNTAKRAAQVM